MKLYGQKNFRKKLKICKKKNTMKIVPINRTELTKSTIFRLIANAHSNPNPSQATLKSNSLEIAAMHLYFIGL